MRAENGPRRLVLRHLAQTISEKPVVDDKDPKLQPGNIRIHSSSKPSLELGSAYTLDFAQTITFPEPVSNQSTRQATLNSVKKFKVGGSPYTLDQTLIDSVYPPPGHSDYWSKSFSLAMALEDDDLVPYTDYTYSVFCFRGMVLRSR